MSPFAEELEISSATVAAAASVDARLHSRSAALSDISLHRDANFGIISRGADQRCAPNLDSPSIRPKSDDVIKVPKSCMDSPKPCGKYAPAVAPEHTGLFILQDFGNAIYVLHAFHKKAKSGISTPRSELDVIRQRLRLAHKFAAGKEN